MMSEHYFIIFFNLFLKYYKKIFKCKFKNYIMITMNINKSIQIIVPHIQFLYYYNIYEVAYVP